MTFWAHPRTSNPNKTAYRSVRTNSTRRLSARPCSVELSPFGWVGPSFTISCGFDYNPRKTFPAARTKNPTNRIVNPVVT